MCKTNILFIIDAYKNPYAGTEGQLLKLINGLDKSKFSARLVVFRSSEYLNKNSFPIPVDTLDIKRIISFYSVVSLFNYFRVKKYEGFRLAHIFFNDASIICPPILKLLGYRVIISRRDMGYWYGHFNLIPLRINAYYVDRVIVNSQAVKNITVLKENYFPQKVDVIYNGYSGCDHDPTPSILDERIASKFEDGDCRIVLVANIRPIKRIADAIYALQKISENVPTANLYIIGDGNASDLQKIAKDLKVATRVHFLGARNDVLELLPYFDVGILCSESEGFSNTLIEYFQAGLPVVCTDVGGNAEIIDNGVNGFLYEVGDVQALASHILIIESDDQLRNSMGSTGKNKVEINYSLKQAVERHQQIYEEVLSSK